MSDELLTQAQIAREFSLSKGTVSDYVKSGRLKPSGETKTGKPLFSREDAKKVSSLAHLNNRKINKASPSSKAHISKVTPDSSFDG
ncbi:helix-turn-helix domain-containing protein [Providencia manganoxydans]|uniref:helix-turn-helix domain-containing protein n=2 Tax=Providencia manganoxydans TaxID=2923283 RepID=UPI003AF38EA8